MSEKSGSGSILVSLSEPGGGSPLSDKMSRFSV